MDAFGTTDIYLGTADNAIQRGRNPDINLAYELTILSILGLKPIVGAPFIWQSVSTLKAVERRKNLFFQEAGPSLSGRPNTKTASDYFSQREQDTRQSSVLHLRPDSPFYVERPGALPLDWKKNIAADVRVKPRSGSVEEYFRYLFFDDIDAPISPLSIGASTLKGLGGEFSNSGKSYADYLFSKIGESAYENHFSRASVESSFLQSEMRINKLGVVLDRTSALYQVANGIAHDSVLFTTPYISSLIPRDINLSVINMYSIHPFNPYLFGDVLNALGVDKYSWVKAGDVEIIKAIYTASPLRLFVQIYYHRLICYLLEWNKRGVAPSYKQAVNILRKDLLLNNDWRSFEAISSLPKRKSDGFSANILGRGIGNSLNLDPSATGSLAKLSIDYSYNLIEQMSFFNILKLRRELRKYLIDLDLI